MTMRLGLRQRLNISIEADLVAKRIVKMKASIRGEEMPRSG